MLDGYPCTFKICWVYPALALHLIKNLKEEILWSRFQVDNFHKFIITNLTNKAARQLSLSKGQLISWIVQSWIIELQKRWEITESEMAEYLEQVRSKILKVANKNDTYHHDDNPTHNAMFRKDYTTIIGRLLPINPFLKDSFIRVGTDITYSEEVCAFIDSSLEVGQKEYKEFVDQGRKNWVHVCVLHLPCI